MGKNLSKKVPILSRIFFAVITVFFILGSVKIPYWAIYQGRGVFKFFLWAAIFGTAVAGYALTTMRGDIRIRLHKVWTPAGILMIVWVWYFMIANALPKSDGLADLLLNQSSETYLFAASFGLLVAFVDTMVLYRYAYYFIPVAVFFFVFQLAGAIVQIPLSLIQSGFNLTSEGINEMNDIWVLLSVIPYAYCAIKKFGIERPTWKKIGISIGIFILFVFILMIINQVVFSNLPPGNWVLQWLRA